MYPRACFSKVLLTKSKAVLFSFKMGVPEENENYRPRRGGGGGSHGFQGERGGGSVVTTVILTSAFTRLNLTRSISDFGVLFAAIDLKFFHFGPHTLDFGHSSSEF